MQDRRCEDDLNGESSPAAVAHVSHENTASPSFFLLKSGSMSESCSSGSLGSLNNSKGNNLEDSGGAWTKVTTKKGKGIQKTKQKQRQQQNVFQKAGKQNGNNRSKKQSKSATFSKQPQVTWRVPHQTNMNKKALAKTYKQVARGNSNSHKINQNRDKSKSFQPCQKSTDLAHSVRPGFSIAEESTTASSYLNLYKEANGEKGYEKEKLRLKLWNILFRNFSRSVDELYYMCEFESSVDQCDEAIKTLGMCIDDFKQLQDRIRTQDEFAKIYQSGNGNETNPSSDVQLKRVSGLAWEVRRSKSVNDKNTRSGINNSYTQRNKHTLNVSKVDSDEAKIQDSFSRVESKSPSSSDSLGPETDSVSADDFELDDKDKIDGCVAEVDQRCETQNGSAKIPKIQSAWLKKPRIIPESVSTPSSNGPKKMAIKPRSNNNQSPSSSSDDAICKDEDSKCDQLSDQKAGPEDKKHSLEQERTSMSCDSSPNEDNEKQKQNSINFFPILRPPMPLRWSDDYDVTPDRTKSTSPNEKPVRKFKKDLIVRTLHEKLSSPERRKPSPCETRRRQVAKQANAELNRAKIERERQDKLKAQSSRQIQAAKAKQEELLAQERAISEKLERAAVAREANLKKVAKKAGNESQKVHEVLFINELTEFDREAMHYRKLENSEKRRQEFIGIIRGKAEKQNERAQARKLREEGRERKLREAIQKRQEDAEKRKAEAWEEQKRRLDEMHVEAPAKVSERRTEMEREREARLAAIKEREKRVQVEHEKLMLARRAIGSCTKVSRSPPPDELRTEYDIETEDSNSITTISQVTTESIKMDTSYQTVNSHSSNVNTHEQNENTHEQNGSLNLKENTKALKKKARKVRNRITTLCQNMDASNHIPKSGYHTSAKLSKRLHKALRDIRNNYCVEEQKLACKRKSRMNIHNEKLKIIETALKDIARSIDVNAEQEQLLQHLHSEKGIDILLSLCTSDGVMYHPEQTRSALAIVSLACTSLPECRRYLTESNMIVPLIDVAVSILREEFMALNAHEKGFVLDSLLLLMSLIRTMVAGLKKTRGEEDDKYSTLMEEVCKYCLHSTLILRLEARFEQLRRGGQWLGCSLRVDSSTSAGLQNNTAKGSGPQLWDGGPKGNWKNASVSEVERALSLVGKGLGMIEGLIQSHDTLIDEGAKVDTPPLIQSAKDSSVFNIVSILVSMYFAVEAQQVASAAHDFSEQMRIVVHVGLRLLNLIALNDFKFVQDTLGSPTLQFEFQKLLRNVLRSCEINDERSEVSNRDLNLEASPESQYSSLPMPPEAFWDDQRHELLNLEKSTRESLFAELIVLLGFYAQCNEQNQESLNWGCAPTPLTRLCSLPFAYFCSQIGKAVLLPTIISICFKNVRAVNIAAKDCCPTLLANYLIEREKQNDEAFAVRFERNHWDSAIEFFSETSN